MFTPIEKKLGTKAYDVPNLGTISQQSTPLLMHSQHSDNVSAVSVGV
jgi:hypothetical protein